jgi:hypothetical protein
MILTMSRSHKYTPISGITLRESEAEFKRASNRRLRLHAKIALAKGAEILPTRPRDITNPWTGPKDGKYYYDDGSPEIWRK